MEGKSCLDCLYANYSQSSLRLTDLIEEDLRKCEHPNSPYSNELVNERTICRLFLDEKEYFRNIDLREKLIKLKKK